MLKLATVTARAFRGIRAERALRLEGKGLLLFGENGSGKSSFVEAIEHALTGDVKSLLLSVSGSTNLTKKGRPALA